MLLKHSHIFLIITTFILISQLNLSLSKKKYSNNGRILKEKTQTEKNPNRNKFTLTLFDDNDRTKCLDGTPYGVGYAPGYETGSRNILINMWGGGWCAGRDKDSFYSDCLDRSKTVLGSSKDWNRKFFWEGTFLGGDPKQNINFYNWHRFDLPYCDGSGHQGHITEPVKVKNETLYFRGHLNTIEAFLFVFDTIDYKDIDNIVLTGCSAGGLATFYWTQYLADYVKLYNKNIKVYGIPDSGFFVNHINLKTKDNDFFLKQQILFNEVNKEVPPVSKDCVRDNLSEMHNCLMAENLFKYIKVPFLMIQPGYDAWQLQNIFSQDCSANNNINKCDEQNKKLAHEYKNYQTKLIEKELKIRENISVWSPSCVTHCFGQNEELSRDWQVPMDSGNNIDIIVKEFLEKEGKNQINLLDKIDWPENSRCARNEYNLLRGDK